MKKNHIIFSIIVFINYSYSQNASILNKNNVSSASSFTSNFNYLASSMNIYGVLLSNAAVLSYNRYIDAVCFIQQKSPTYSVSPISQNNSGAVVAYVGKNFGTQWDSTVVWANSTNQGRFPQGGYYNPIGNSNFNNAYVVSTGAVNNGSGFVGSFYASKSVSLTPKNAGGLDQQFMSNTAPFSSSTSTSMTKHDFPRYSFTATDDGMLRAAGTLYQDVNGTSTLAQNIRGAFVAEGSFNAGVFVWTPDSFIPPCINRTEGTKILLGETNVAWNDAGTVGYVMMIGARIGSFNSNKGYQPILWKTTNSGNNWALLNSIDFNSSGWSKILNSIDPVTTNSNITAPSFNLQEGIGLTVDDNNNLHIFTTVKNTLSSHVDSLNFSKTYTINGTPGYNWEFKNNKYPYLIDFFGNGLTWNYTIIDSLGTQAFNDPTPTATVFPWLDAAVPQNISNARLQVSSNVSYSSGQFLSYSWAESDTMNTTNNKKWNEKPNIKVRAWRITDNTLSQDEHTITSPTVNPNPRIQNKAYFHYMSKHFYHTCINNSQILTKIPITVSNNLITDGDAPVDHFYSNAEMVFNFPYVFQGCIVGLPENLQEENELIIYPNPTNYMVNLKLNLTMQSSVCIEVYDVMGRQVHKESMHGVSGDNIFKFNLNNLNTGVYLVKAIYENTTSVKKLILE